MIQVIGIVCFVVESSSVASSNHPVKFVRLAPSEAEVTEITFGNEGGNQLIWPSPQLGDLV